MKQALLMTLEMLACLAIAALFWWALTAPTQARAQMCQPGEILVCDTVGGVTICQCI